MLEPVDREYAYQTVYAYVMTLVAEATSEHKVRLPSLRGLAQRMRVSVSTVKHAYQLLESEGHVVSVAKSGYFATVSHSPPEPLPVPVQHHPADHFDLIRSVRRHACDPGMLALHRSDPWSSDALGLRLNRQEREVQRQHANLGCHPLGEPELRRELAARYTHASEQLWCADDVYLASDLRTVLDIVLAALDIRGKSVLVASPAAPTLLLALDAAGAVLCELPLDAHGGLDLERLARHLRTMPVALAVLDSTINGRSGTLMPHANRLALASLLERYGTWVLEDDDHGALCFAPSSPLRALIDPTRLLVCGSFARSIGAEASYGYVLVRDAVVGAAVRECTLQRHLRLPPVRQKAIARLIQRGALDRDLNPLRASLQRNLARMAQQLQDHLGELVKAPVPAGGCGLWLTSRYPIDGRKVYERLLGKRILIAPGQMFSGQGHHCQSLRIGCPVDGRGLPGRVVVQLLDALQHARH